MYPQEEVAQPRDRRAWTDDEDELLRAAIDKEDPEANPPSKWHAIAKHIPNRTNKDCRKRWWAQMATRVSKGSWSTEEDERLFTAVEELGTKWAAVAGRVGTRNSGQCAKRWNDALNPAIDRSGWTPEEDQKLLNAVEHQGHSWANIARTYLPGRTGLAAKNRYNHLIRGSSDRASSTRGRRLSTASAMRRRTARGSSISSLSSPSSPRSTVTPPPSRSSASSPGSSGALHIADGLAAHSPIDLRHHWNPILGDGSMLDDVPELSPSGSTSRASSTYSHSSSPSLESQMLNMLMQNSLSEFFDPSLDPSGLSPLSSSTYSLEPCTPNSLISDSGDPWASGYFPYLDFTNPGAQGSLSFDPQLTPSLSTPGLSTSGSSVHGTPQLADAHYGMHHPARFLPMAEPHVAIAQYPALADLAPAHYMQGVIDPHDPRLGAYALCERQGLDMPHGLASMLGHPMAATA